MDDNQCQYEPRNEGIYASESKKTHYCKQCGSTENPERDETRGEICCPSCGLVLEEKLYDEQHPKTHANTPENNSGRGTLGPSKSFGSTDYAGTPIKDRKAWARRGKINTSIQWDAEDTNKVVEASIRQLKKINYTLSQAKENYFRKLLMDTLKTSEENVKLFKSGSKYNDIACALVLHSDIDLRMFHEMLRYYAKANNIAKKEQKSIKRRGREILRILNHKLDNHSNQLAPVYPHIIDVNNCPSEIYEAFIGQWWGKKIDSIRMYSKSPKYNETIKLINIILDNPNILGLNGGEMLEPILDACLVISMKQNSHSLQSGQIMEKLSLTPSSRNYHRPLQKYLNQRF